LIYPSHRFASAGDEIADPACRRHDSYTFNLFQLIAAVNGTECHGRDPARGHLDLDNFRKVRAVAAVALLLCDDAGPDT